MEEVKKGKDGNLWDKKQLAINNWFSGTSYFKVNNINGD